MIYDFNAKKSGVLVYDESHIEHKRKHKEHSSY